ncbi:DUF4190 domain-containing protein [Streptomyces sp. NPDC026206]|uniref:DUF4190 domain-containing protein n=1 Tax=Streptomyces sp. NPDC026206 TaxID=3157089 RepID=UPI0033CA5449
MSDKDDAQPEPQDRNPWAPPERRVPLDKPGTEQVPSVPHCAQPGPGPAAGMPAPPPAPSPPFVPGAPLDAAIPPIPPAPTGPGTPSAYPAGPYAYGQPGPYPQQPYGPGAAPGAYAQDPYGQAPYGQTGYGTAAYGYPVAGYGQGWPAPAGAIPDNSLGVAALVLGIVGTVLSPSIIFGVILGILAIVFGAMGRSKAATGEANNGGQALAGLILGGVALLATALLLVLYISVGGSADTGQDEDPEEATYGAYMPEPPAPAPFEAAARR